MGRIGILRRFDRIVRGLAHGSEATVDMGGGENTRAVNFGPAGDDTVPLPGDYVVVVDGPGTGGELVVGYSDPVNVVTTSPGDKRIYSRDPVDGTPMCQVLLGADGQITITSPTASIVMDVAGVITANGVTITPAGDITTTGSITAASVVAAGKELAAHTHPVTSAPGTTGPNT